MGLHYLCLVRMTEFPGHASVEGDHPRQCLFSTFDQERVTLQRPSLEAEGMRDSGSRSQAIATLAEDARDVTGVELRYLMRW
jgi:hypothetical protein